MKASCAASQNSHSLTAGFRNLLAFSGRHVHCNVHSPMCIYMCNKGFLYSRWYACARHARAGIKVCLRSRYVGAVGCTNESTTQRSAGDPDYQRLPEPVSQTDPMRMIATNLPQRCSTLKPTHPNLLRSLGVSAYAVHLRLLISPSILNTDAPVRHADSSAP